MLLSVMIPTRTALAAYGPPSTPSRAKMLIETRLGAAQLIAHQAPIALRPDDPSLLTAIAPPTRKACATTSPATSTPCSCCWRRCPW
ncbi:hypothetical protein ACFQ9X_00615 [Catenulispora yoronensis]